MSITSQLVRISPSELNEILSDQKGSKLQALLDEWTRRPGYEEFESLCWRYTHAGISQKGMRWAGSVAEELAHKSGITEQQVKQEVQRRGWHLWLDLEKYWNELHILLTGEALIKQSGIGKDTAREQHNVLCQEVTAAIEKSQSEIQNMVIELKGLLSKDTTQTQRQIGQQIVFAPQFLVQTKVAIAKLEESYDADVIRSCEPPMREAVRSAAGLKDLMSALLGALHAVRLEEAEKISQQIFVETKNLNQLQQKLLSVMYANPKKQLVTEETVVNSDNASHEDLLSATVTGSARVPGSTKCRFLTADQVKTIAEKLKRMKYDDLAPKSNAGVQDFAHCFEKFQEFYLDASKAEEAIVSIMS